MVDNAIKFRLVENLPFHLHLEKLATAGSEPVFPNPVVLDHDPLPVVMAEGVVGIAAVDSLQHAGSGALPA